MMSANTAADHILDESSASGGQGSLSACGRPQVDAQEDVSAPVHQPSVPSNKPGPASRQDNRTIHSIGIAGLRVVTPPDCIRTVLGSCIGIALFDRVAKVGGMAHVILPDSSEGSGDPGKFADTALDILVEILLEHSAKPERIAAKIAGGAAMFGEEHAATLGRRNAEAVEAKLRQWAIRLAGSAIGGTRGRKMMLDPATGNVRVEVIGERPQMI